MDSKEIYYNEYGNQRSDEDIEQILVKLNSGRFREQTPYITLTDSSDFYFKTKPYPSGFVCNDTIEKLQKEQYNTDDFYICNPVEKWRSIQYSADILRIKEKYKLRDTLVYLSGECSYPAKFTKNNRLFSYEYWGYLFKIEHFSKNKKIATKYIIVNMLDFC
jgi:hypothetical protein